MLRAFTELGFLSHLLLYSPVLILCNIVLDYVIPYCFFHMTSHIVKGTESLVLV